MGLLDRIKGKLLKEWITRTLSPVDTEEKREIIMNNEVKKGMNNTVAWLLAIVGGAIIQAVQQAADGGDLSLIFHDPAKLFAAVLSAALIGIAHRLTAPNTVSVPTDATAKQIGAAVEKVLEQPKSVTPQSASPAEIGREVVASINR